MSSSGLGFKPTGTALRLACLGVGLAGAAVNTGNNLLYLLLGLALATLPVGLLGGWLNLSGLAVELRPPRWARAGAVWKVEVRLRRRYRWAARGLELRLWTARGAGGSAWIEKVDGRGTLVFALEGEPSPRGVERIEQVTLRSAFPLGILRRTVTLEREHEILILPRTDENVLRASREHTTRAGEGARRRSVTGDEYEGTRRGGDREDLRKVDWKATARRGSLMLRETIGSGAEHLTLDLVTRLEQQDAPALERFESRVSGIAAECSPVLERGGSVHLTLDGRDGQSWVGPRAIIPLLSRLARVVPRDRSGNPIAPAANRRRRSERASAPAEQPAAPAERAHHLSALSALAVGTLALFGFGGIGVAAFSAIALSFVAVAVSRGRLVARPGGAARAVWNVAAIGALILFVAELAFRSSVLSACLHLIVFISLYLLFNASSFRDDRMLLLTSSMQLVLSAALTTDVAFALPLVAWLLAVLHAQAAWSSLPEASARAVQVLPFDPAGPPWRYARAASLAACALAFTGLALFAIVPHVGTGTFDLYQQRPRISGFAESASLGDIGRIRLDHRPVMEVALRGSPEPALELKWRGTALEAFDGRTWRRVPSAVQPFPADGSLLHEAADQGAALVQEIRLEPNAAAVLFAAERPFAVVSRDIRTVFLSESGTLEAGHGSRQRLDYVVTSELVPRDPERLRASVGEDPRALAERNLELPALDPRIPALARQLVEGSTTRYDAARAIERWVREQYVYAIDVRDTGLADPLAAFLFDGLAGHCEYFATSMVVLARSAGIPARFVSGYLRGETNRFNRRFLVRNSDAHAWVEVHFPDLGWIPFDPTPPQARSTTEERGLMDLFSDLRSTVSRLWDDHLIAVDLEDQYQALLAVRERLLTAVRGVRSGLSRTSPGLLLLAPACAALFWWARTLWRKRTRREACDRPPAFYTMLLAWLARRGIHRGPAETPAELARRAAAQLTPDAAVRVRQLTDLYYRVRYGNADESGARPVARLLLAELRQDSA